MATSSTPASTDLLAVLLHLGRRARQAEDEAELGFILVNETNQLAPYRQGALWLPGEGVVTLSGVVMPEANAPYVQWLSRLCEQWSRAGRDKPWVIQAADLHSEDVREWSHWLPAQALCVPLPAVGRYFAGGLLLLARDLAWSDGELALLAEWAAIWSSVRVLVDQGSGLTRLWQRLHGRPAPLAPAKPTGRLGAMLKRPRTWGWLLLCLLLLLPVRLTVLAPAELVPLNPTLVRAPIDGVIERVHVMPNEAVDAQRPLFEFDRTSIGNRLLIAERSKETVRAELRQHSQQALFDESSKAKLALLQGQLAEKQIELEYLRELDQRSLVSAERAGIVLYDDPSEWVGRPVVTGERVMVIADEREAEVEAWLSPANAISLAMGSRVRVYLNADPLRPVQASLRYVSHEATERPDGHYAYRVRASLSRVDERSRIGLKGTAKLEGGRVPLIYWVMRRPVASLRAWLGI
ncbi:HlyD family efflux transporter periplasmic adaptor subunit [Thiorhodovibrio winogradskyi]|uniref:HlyD family efflux transporter periplasmic adaptor subunit n=1 Tax=Thiorhodovibrio winogradskyi TaxID=77007 RepID=UPI002E288EE5|nr:HlyD family efflux transporter periplasmic adaptor subunit [Thiorhodovibrio winogradskyi]